MPHASAETIHASCVAIRGRGVLIAGRSGAGKSDLALRLLDRGATLVSDDYTELHRMGDSLVARAPATIAGRIEVRGIGIVAWPAMATAPVALLVDLDGRVDRMPVPTTRPLAGIEVPALALAALKASAPIKVELALDAIGVCA